MIEVILYGTITIIWIFGIALLLPDFIAYLKSGRKTEHTERKIENERPDIISNEAWNQNRYRTPLSHAEEDEVARKAAEFYDEWTMRHSVKHTWLTMMIYSDRLECSSMLRAGYSGSAPVLTVRFSHPLSCQADREQLAAHILRRIREKYPDTGLYLDYDGLILPANLG